MKITKSRLRQIIKEEMAKIEEDLAIGNLDCSGLQKEYDVAKARLARNVNSSRLQQDVRDIENMASNMGCQDFDFDFDAPRICGPANLEKSVLDITESLRLLPAALSL